MKSLTSTLIAVFTTVLVFGGGFLVGTRAMTPREIADFQEKLNVSNDAKFAEISKSYAERERLSKIETERMRKELQTNYEAKTAEIQKKFFAPLTTLLAPTPVITLTKLERTMSLELWTPDHFCDLVTNKNKIIYDHSFVLPKSATTPEIHEAKNEASDDNTRITVIMNDTKCLICKSNSGGLISVFAFYVRQNNNVTPLFSATFCGKRFHMVLFDTRSNFKKNTYKVFEDGAIVYSSVESEVLLPYVEQANQAYSDFQTLYARGPQ